jgi:plasmid stabilization system protein ParE
MNLFQFTPQAEADLIDIWSYIASDNLESAGRWKRQFTRLVRTLRMGRRLIECAKI